MMSPPSSCIAHMLLFFFSLWTPCLRDILCNFPALPRLGTVLLCTRDIMFRWTTLENTQLDKHYILELLERSLWIGRPRDSLPWFGSILEGRKGKTTMLLPLLIDKIQEGRDYRTLYPLRAECNQMDSVCILQRRSLLVGLRRRTQNCTSGMGRSQYQRDPVRWTKSR